MNVVFAIDERNHKVHTSKVDKPGAERKSDEGIRQQIRFCEQNCKIFNVKNAASKVPEKII